MRLGITFSTFDFFQAGYVRMLEDAKRQCDYLIIGLHLDLSIDHPEKNGHSKSIIDQDFTYIDDIVNGFSKTIEKNI